MHEVIKKFICILYMYMYFKPHIVKTQYFASVLWFINLHNISTYLYFVMLLHLDVHKSDHNM